MDLEFDDASEKPAAAPSMPTLSPAKIERPDAGKGLYWILHWCKELCFARGKSCTASVLVGVDGIKIPTSTFSLAGSRDLSVRGIA